MRKLFTTLAACSFVAASFAATIMPESGVYYPGDINNSGVIHVEFNDSVAAPTATINVNGSSVNANMFEEGVTGRFWAVEIQEALQDVVTTNGTEISLTVKGGSETVTGSYTYMPVFPLTSITPENYSTVEEKTFNAIFTFDQIVSYTGATIVSGDKVRNIGSGNGKTVTIAINESDWATASSKQNSISVQLNGVTLSNGSHISNVSGATDAIVANYFFNETVAIQFLGVNPDPTDATYQEVYDGYWYASFMFNDAVSLVEDEKTVCATVTFYDGYGEYLDDVELTSMDVFGGWNYRGGYYSVDVAVPEVPASASGYASVEIELNNVSYNGKLLASMPTVTYYANLPSKSVKKSNMVNGKDTAGINIIESNNSVDVYSIQGNVVKQQVAPEEINNLPAGIYIIEGKKFVVR